VVRSGFFYRFFPKFSLGLSLLCLISSLICCVSIPAKPTLSARIGDQQVRIAFVHFQAIQPDESQRTVACPLTGMIARSCGNVNGSERILERYFRDELRSSYNKYFISAERTEGVYRRISSGSFKMPQDKLLRRVGEELNADAVLAGYLYCFRERVGYDYAAENPASVAFGIYLIRVSDGAVIWKGVFDKTQRSLSEDVLQFSSFVKEKGKWVQAEFLLKEGVEEVMQSFPELR
jgi:hypothetical protein